MARNDGSGGNQPKFISCNSLKTASPEDWAKHLTYCDECRDKVHVIWKEKVGVSGTTPTPSTATTPPSGGGGNPPNDEKPIGELELGDAIGRLWNRKRG